MRRRGPDNMKVTKTALGYLDPLTDKIIKDSSCKGSPPVVDVLEFEIDEALEAPPAAVYIGSIRYLNVPARLLVQAVRNAERKNNG